MISYHPQEDSHAWQAGPVRHVLSDPLSPGCIDAVRHWLGDCQKNHLMCTQSSMSSVASKPRRLIQVGPRSNAEIRLVDLEGMTQIGDEPYVALSHCWGHSQHLVTQRNSLASWKVNIPAERLPRTFLDAISITRILGLRYVWIDSLCIVQDDNRDWEIEAAKMGSIFDGAHLVIAATASEDGDGGCLFARLPHVIIDGEDADGKAFSIHARHAIRHDPFYWDVPDAAISRVMQASYKPNLGSHYPLLSRAWCFQERLLGKRILHFTKDEMIFECLTSTQCECGALAGFRGDPLLEIRQLLARQAPQLQSNVGWVKDTVQYARHGEGPQDTDLSETWRDLISQYSQKHITRPSDILPALGGLAGAWLYTDPGRYLAGLWSSDIYRGLLWQSVSRDSLKQLDYLVPSWSWASVQHGVGWAHGDDRSKYHVEINVDDIVCTAKGMNPFGEVAVGWLPITGTAVRGTLKILNPVDDSGSKGFVCRTTKAGKAISNAFTVDSVSRCRQVVGGEVLCMLYCTDNASSEHRLGFRRALVLGRPAESDIQRVPESIRGHQHLYQRLGLMEHYPKEEWCHDEEGKEIVVYLI